MSIGDASTTHLGVGTEMGELDAVGALLEPLAVGWQDSDGERDFAHS